MGRQIAIAMDAADEQLFWNHLHSIANISVFRSWSPSEDPVGSFVVDRGAHTFYILNRAFPWQPKFERVDYRDKETGEPGFYFRIVDRHAPLVIYSRHPLSATNPGGTGRLYWSKYFVSQPGQLLYDVEGFDKWFNALMRWTRKNGVRIKHGLYDVWSLPGARQQIEAGS
jgi:hypothetical protein